MTERHPPCQGPCCPLY
ncbi:hypothetical protein LEMLEM_LOCUS2178 [Lemmus lemmus]